MDIRELLEKADKKLFKVRSVDPDCQLSIIIPKKKETKYQLRNNCLESTTVNKSLWGRKKIIAFLTDLRF